MRQESQYKNKQLPNQWVINAVAYFFTLAGVCSVCCLASRLPHSGPRPVSFKTMLITMRKTIMADFVLASQVSAPKSHMFLLLNISLPKWVSQAKTGIREVGKSNVSPEKGQSVFVSDLFCLRRVTSLSQVSLVGGWSLEFPGTHELLLYLFC